MVPCGNKITSAGMNNLAGRLEIWVEDRSTERFLLSLLPRILPPLYALGVNCHVRPHEGKQDLQKSIPNKVRAYRKFHAEVKIVIIQDQDQEDCVDLKNKLRSLVAREDPSRPLLVRIACRELENWYLGDLDAVQSVYPKSKAAGKTNKAKFRNPDNLQGAEEMRRLSPQFQKGSCASKIGKCIRTDASRSTSFIHFVSGIQKFCAG